MAHLNWTFQTYVTILKTASTILVLTVNLWIALSQSNQLIFGVCVGSCLTSLVGFVSLKRILFVVPLLALAIILINTIITASSKELTAQIIQTLQFLLLIYTIEIGNSTIHLNRILQRMKEPKHIPAMTKALKHYTANLTAIITASFTLSTLFLFLGSLTQLKFEPIFLVATATVILLTTLAFLSANLRYPTTKTK